MLQIKYIKTDENAITPSRAYPTDIGMDLVAIRKHKVMDHGVILYDTGLAVTPPEGCYIEILPRSSISKTGWMLANSVGVIDRTYTGNLYVALVRVCPTAPELEPPFCVTQIVLRKAEYAEMKEVEVLESTDRGNGGFGSSGQRVD